MEKKKEIKHIRSGSIGGVMMPIEMTTLTAGRVYKQPDDMNALAKYSDTFSITKNNEGFIFSFYQTIAPLPEQTSEQDAVLVARVFLSESNFKGLSEVIGQIIDQPLPPDQGGDPN